MGLTVWATVISAQVTLSLYLLPDQDQHSINTAGQITLSETLNTAWTNAPVHPAIVHIYLNVWKKGAFLKCGAQEQKVFTGGTLLGGEPNPI